MNNEIEGIINLDKPTGLSSAQALNRIKRLLPKGVKLGHAGTLDPFATGVLLVLVGKATRRCEQLMDRPKTYEATVRLGATTLTDDPSSEPTPWKVARQPTRAEVERTTAGFVGEIHQRPPAFSALKVGGRRAYALARRGTPPRLPPRPVRIDRIEILNYHWPLLRIRVECGRGAYIRALARDLGEALSVGGYLTELRRTRVGEFDASHAVTLETLMTEGPEKYLQRSGG